MTDAGDATAVHATAVHATAISPTPTVEEAVAIAAALEAGWPRLVVAGGTTRPPSRWRFSGRWWSKPVPNRRERP